MIVAGGADCKRVLIECRKLAEPRVERASGHVGGRFEVAAVAARIAHSTILSQCLQRERSTR